MSWSIPPYRRAPYTAELIEQIIKDFEFEAAFADLSRDAQLIADQVKRQLLKLGALRLVERAQLVRHGFYRGMGCYLVAVYSAALKGSF